MDLQKVKTFCAEASSVCLSLLALLILCFVLFTPAYFFVFDGHLLLSWCGCRNFVSLYIVGISKLVIIFLLSVLGNKVQAWKVPACPADFADPLAVRADALAFFANPSADFAGSLAVRARCFGHFLQVRLRIATLPTASESESDPCTLWEPGDSWGWITKSGKWNWEKGWT